MATDPELQAMRLAIALSAHGLATTSPNPPVGCVILDRAGTTIGTGFHRRKGGPHAERCALEEAGDRAKGGTAVVTLEPCNHVGRTPACHQGLLDAGIERVVVAIIDPTSRREGGVALLREAGVEVEVGVLANEARIVLGPWLDSLAAKRPEVTALLRDDKGDSHLSTERCTVDAVILRSGEIEEGVAGSHGEGALDLPPANVSGPPSKILSNLYQGGTRSVLLDADRNMIELFRAAGCLDRVVAYLDPERGFSMMDGFVIARIEKRARLVRLEFIPSRDPQN